MTFGFIEAEKARFPISRMCRVLGVSQSGFFAWQDRPACRRQQQDMVYLAHIRTAFALSNGTYGSPRMHRDLVDEGHEIGRHRTARLMRENQLIARQKRRFKRTTDCDLLGARSVAHRGNACSHGCATHIWVRRDRRRGGPSLAIDGETTNLAIRSKNPMFSRALIFGGAHDGMPRTEYLFLYEIQ